MAESNKELTALSLDLSHQRRCAHHALTAEHLHEVAELLANQALFNRQTGTLRSRTEARKATAVSNARSIDQTAFNRLVDADGTHEEQCWQSCRGKMQYTETPRTSSMATSTTRCSS